MRVNRSSLLFVAATGCWMAWGSTASADWASCQAAPTRNCLLDEALRGDKGRLAGKDRIDFLVQTNYRNHPEYLTAADIDEAKQQATDQAGTPTARYNYFLLATTGLLATKRVQEAFDLVSVLDVGWRINAVNQMTIALINADQLDDVPVFGRSMLADPRGIFDTAVQTLAGKDKIEQALALMELNPVDRPDQKEMLVAIGAAYAVRGDPKMAARFYDKAQSELERQKSGAAIQDDTAIELRFDRMVLQALRGDFDGVKAALKELPPVSDKAVDRIEIQRNLGYHKLVSFLLRVNHPEIAADIARSAPERYRVSNLLIVGFWDTLHDRLDDANAILRSLGDNVDPKLRGAMLRLVAVAEAKSGKVASAVALASEASDPVWRRIILFEVAQTLPP